MTDKKLKEKAVSIKGKDYILVKDRVLYFNDECPNGCIQSRLLSAPESRTVVVKAKVTPDVSNPERYFTGLAQEEWGQGQVNKTSALENAETSAVGRALGFMGIGVIDSVASGDEMRKATGRTASKSACPHCGATGKYHAPDCPNNQKKGGSNG